VSALIWHHSPSELTRSQAKRIIQDVGSTGQPPIFGYQLFSAGLDPWLKTLEEEYLKDYIRSGGSAFKLVTGTYGEGKTHFLYSVRGLAWMHNYISSYIELKPDETPLHNLESVYRSIVANLLYPQSAASLLESGYDRGIEAVLKIWYYSRSTHLRPNLTRKEYTKTIHELTAAIGPFESSSYTNALRHAFLALHDKDDQKFNLILQWLKGETPPTPDLQQYHIHEKLDSKTGFKFIRCLIQWLREIGYVGLVILMDEAEKTPGMTAKEREKLLNNLRAVIDACSKGEIKGSMIFYAVPDVSFLEGRTNVYEALNQRLSTIFEGAKNPTGVRINLEQLWGTREELLTTIGQKLAGIYEKAYGIRFDPDLLDDRIQSVITKVLGEKFGEVSYKRLFVQEIIKNFHELKSEQRNEARTGPHAGLNTEVSRTTEM